MARRLTSKFETERNFGQGYAASEDSWRMDRLPATKDGQRKSKASAEVVHNVYNGAETAQKAPRATFGVEGISDIGRPERTLGSHPTTVRAQKMNPDFEDNLFYMDYMTDLMAIPKPAVDDAQGLMMAFKEYLDLCRNYGIRPRNQACYMALGLDHHIVVKMSEGKYDDESLRMVADTIRRICATSREDLLETGKISSKVGLTWQMAYDSVQVAQETINYHISGKNIDEIAQKYAQDVEIDV